jgi:hypothetical protein
MPSDQPKAAPVALGAGGGRPIGALGVSQAASAPGDVLVETTFPDLEIRHTISDADAVTLMSGSARSREADQAFDIFLAAAGVCAGSVLQAARDIANTIYFKAAPDSWGMLGIAIFFVSAGVCALAFILWRRWKDQSPAELKLQEIRDRTNRTLALVKATDMRQSRTDST